MSEVLVEQRSGPRTCAWCHGPVGVARRCDGCGTAVHDACVRAGCPTLGCREAPRRAGRRLLELPGVPGATALVALLLGVCSVSAAQAVPRLAPIQAARRAALAPTPPPSATESLLRHLAAPDPEVRLAAVWFLGEELGRARQPRVELALTRAAALDRSERVRRSARLALERTAARSGIVGPGAR